MIYSEEAETAIISTLVQTNCFDDLTAPLQGNSFYYPDFGLIFKTIQKQAAAGKPYDYVSLLDFLKGSVAPDVLASLINHIPTRSRINVYANIVINKARIRKVSDTCYTIIDKCKQPEFKDDVVLADIETALFSHELDNSGFVQGEDIALDVIADIARKAETPDGVIGLKTGFERYDAVIGGFCPSDLIIIAGRPSMGKTALALNIATFQASQGEEVGIISLEMSKEQLVMRILSTLTGISVAAMRTGQVTDKQLIQLEQAKAKIATIHIDDKPAQHINQIQSNARRLHRRHKISCLFVDYMQLARGESKDSREREISQISAGMKSIAKELNIPVVCLSQLSRKCEARPDKRPLMSDLRDSGSIEQDADVIAFVYRHEQYSDNEKHKGKAELLIEKNRQGKTGTINLDFAGETMTFKNQFTMHVSA